MKNYTFRTHIIILIESMRSFKQYLRFNWFFDQSGIITSTRSDPVFILK